MRYFYILVFCLSLMTPKDSCSQEINWVSFDTLPALLDGEPKPLLIFIHTDWCKVCATQEETTFHDPEVVEYLNEHYYSLKLNAETTEDITFLNRTYHFKSTGSKTGIHELAEILGMRMGMVSYPTTIILSKDMELTERLVGLQPAKELMTELQKLK